MLTRTLTLVLAGVLSSALLACATGERSQDGQPAHAANLSKQNLAVDGYDPVAYFDEGGGEPAKGSAQYEVTYRGATYRFANAENRARFLEQPSRYEPAYGGWCAYAMAFGDRVEVDPKTFRIEDGSLLLFYKSFLTDTARKWDEEGSDALRARADESWLRLTSEARRRDVSAYHLGEGGLALEGYDPVAYTTGSPARGEPSLQVAHRGVVYRFASDANRDAFLAEPSRYEPAYGGWCACSMAKGETVAPEPELFLTGADGRTLLFAASDLRDAWKADPSLASAADREWSRRMQ